MDNIIQQVISGLEGIAVTAILAVLGIAIKGAGEIVIQLLSVKRDEVIAKIGAERYNFYSKVAEDVYNSPGRTRLRMDQLPGPGGSRGLSTTEIATSKAGEVAGNQDQSRALARTAPAIEEIKNPCLGPHSRGPGLGLW